LCRVGLSGHHQLLAGSIPAVEMFMTKVVGALAIGVALLSGIPVTADPDACPGAGRMFRSAKNSVGDYLRRYASCVSRSNGHDNCAREFAQLRPAQDDFELAVSGYDRECL
jgi:hypothetical protein